MKALLNPYLLLALIVGFLAAVGGGYQWGSSVTETNIKAETGEALNNALTKVRTLEAELSTKTNGVSNDYEVKGKKLDSNIDAALLDHGRMRINPRCPNSMPTIAPGPGKLDASAESGTNRARAGEINLDDVAKQTIELGGDLDKANLNIIELQSLVRIYEKACRVE